MGWKKDLIKNLIMAGAFLGFIALFLALPFIMANGVPKPVIDWSDLVRAWGL